MPQDIAKKTADQVVEKPNGAIFEQQVEAPAPAQSYHQVSVTKTDVALRTWPKRRMSQSWSREGSLNPSTTKVSYDEFLKGELQDQIKHIFGDNTLEKILGIISSKK
jgi:hypothetical protein